MAACWPRSRCGWWNGWWSTPRRSSAQPDEPSLTYGHRRDRGLPGAGRGAALRPDRGTAAARSGLLAAGAGDWLADGLIELYQDYRHPDEYAARVHSTVRELTEVEPRTLDQALADP